MMRLVPTCLVFVLLPAWAGQPASTHAVVRKPSANVYAAPQAGAETIEVLKQDAAVQVGQQTGLWYQVRLPDGKTGFVRVNDIRFDYAGAGDASGNLVTLAKGKPVVGHVTETAGVRGIDESELRTATADTAQVDALIAYRVAAATAATRAAEQGWQPTTVRYPAEAKPAVGGGIAESGAAAVRQLGGVVDAFGQKVGSLFGHASKALPKSEKDQLAEELALGPLVAGRVLGVRPLWDDASAQQRVNLIGRWVASQTSRPDLPWTFGVIDTPELNAFAAPGGFILVTRGLYELGLTDGELAAVLGHEIGHCVQRDHYHVIRKQELAALGKDEVSSRIETGSSAGETLARRYVEENGAAILLTTLDREAEYGADQAAEIYLARSGMNPLSLYSVLQKMLARGEKSPNLAALYKTHPPLGARLDRIDQRGYAGLESYIERP